MVHNTGYLMYKDLQLGEFDAEVVTLVTKWAEFANRRYDVKSVNLRFPQSSVSTRDLRSLPSISILR